LFLNWRPSPEFEYMGHQNSTVYRRCPVYSTCIVLDPLILAAACVFCRDRRENE
jgi:hypothetical protein